MNRQWKLNLGLLTLIALLVILSFLRPGLEAPKPRVAVTQLDLESVQKLQIEQPGKPTVLLQRIDTGWRLLQPLQAQADLFRVNEVLRVAHSQSLNRLPYKAKADAGKFGLDSPKVTVHYDDLTIRFGDTSPINQQQYLLVGDTLNLVSPNTLWSVNRPANDYIERRLIKRKNTPDRIRFTDGNALQQIGGSWHLKKPVATLPSDALTQMVNEWRYATALRVVPEKSVPGIGNVQLRFPGDKGKSETINIEIVAYTPDLVLFRRDEGLLYYFPADTARRLMPATDRR